MTEKSFREELLEPWRWRNIKRLLLFYAAVYLVGMATAFIVFTCMAWWNLVSG